MSDPTARTTVGVLSDTHGSLPDGAREALLGCDLIIHAGDVGSEEILYELQTIAPVVAVAGNVDQPFPTWFLPHEATAEAGGVRFFVLHDLASLKGAIPDADVVISGHTHYPQVLEREGVLFVNPGSTSRSRSREIGHTLALVVMAQGRIRPKIVSI